MGGGQSLERTLLSFLFLMAWCYHSSIRPSSFVPTPKRRLPQYHFVSFIFIMHAIYLALSYSLDPESSRKDCVNHCTHNSEGDMDGTGSCPPPVLDQAIRCERVAELPLSAISLRANLVRLRCDPLKPSKVLRAGLPHIGKQ